MLITRIIKRCPKRTINISPRSERWPPATGRLGHCQLVGDKTLRGVGDSYRIHNQNGIDGEEIDDGKYFSRQRAKMLANNIGNTAFRRIGRVNESRQTAVSQISNRKSEDKTISSGQKPPIPALIGRNSTPAPMAVPNRPRTQTVSSLCHFAGSEYPLLIIIFSVFIGQVLSMHDAKARMFSL